MSTLKAAAEAALGKRVRRLQPVLGGDINEAYRLSTADGHDYFLKTHQNPPEDLYTREAEGLHWLREAEAIRIPQCFYHSNRRGAEPALLILEWIDSAPPCPRHDELLGRGLAKIHLRTEAQFGLPDGNYIGSLHQRNRKHKTWHEFYANERLLPQFELADQAGLIPSNLAKAFDTLLNRLAEIVGPEEPPSRLHGDLWGGNTIRDEKGEPCLIDPAIYAGHREVDLAMMRLFGGFSPRVFSAYEEYYPTAQGSGERIPLYQLYYLFVHLNLFGSSYLSGVRRAVQCYI